MQERTLLILALLLTLLSQANQPATGGHSQPSPLARPTTIQQPISPISIPNTLSDTTVATTPTTLGPLSRMAENTDTEKTDGRAHSVNPALAADGNLVVFAARGLVLDADADGTTHDDSLVDFWQIYAYDRTQNTVYRISVTPGGQAGNGSSGGSPPVVSADGQRIAFTSAATNLVFGDSNDATDVFVYDRAAQRMTRVSVATSGAQANRDSYLPAISADGNVVAFVSQANNLVPGDSNGVADVFIHDLQSRATRRVSISSNGIQANGSAGLSAPALSGDGRFVAFVSQADNLVAGDSNDVADVFVHDLPSRETHRVSLGSDGAQARGASTAPALAADGRYVAFLSTAADLVPASDGAAVGDHAHVYLHDRQSGQTVRVSTAYDGAPGNGPAYGPTISADGRFVAFAAAADNLVPDNLAESDTNGVIDVFLHDGLSGQIERVSQTDSGTQSNGLAWRPALGGYGRFVAFESTATNLTALDQAESVTPTRAAIYLRDRGPQATGAYTLTGQVLGPDDAPVAGLRVQVGRRFPRQAITDAEGRFAVTNLPAGDYGVDLDTSRNADPAYLFRPEFPQVVTVGADADSGADPAAEAMLTARAYPCRAPSGLDLCTLRPGDILLATTPHAADWPQVGGTYFTQASLYVGLAEDHTEDNEDNNGAHTDAARGPQVILAQTMTDAITPTHVLTETALLGTPLWTSELWTSAGLLDWAVVRPDVSSAVAGRAAEYARAWVADPAVGYGFFGEDGVSAPTPAEGRYTDAGLIVAAYAQAGHSLLPATRLGPPALAGWDTPDDLYWHSGQTPGAQVQRAARADSEGSLLIWSQGLVHLALVGENGVRMGYRPADAATLAPPTYLYSSSSDARVTSLAVPRVETGIAWQVELTGRDADGDADGDTGGFLVGWRRMTPNATLTLNGGTLAPGASKTWPLVELQPEGDTLFVPAVLR